MFDTTFAVTAKGALYAQLRRLQTAERTVRYFGLVPKWGKNVGKRAGYTGGSIEERVDDLHAMFADLAVKGVFCVRGVGSDVSPLRRPVRLHARGLR